MEVLKVVPRGYCYGVVDAITLAKRAVADKNLPRPIYILGQIVHNRHIVAELNHLGVVTLDGSSRKELIEQVNGGTVVLTAHGVSPLVKERARKRAEMVIDATCPDVTKTHQLIKRLAADGVTILYIGKKNHPEPEGSMGEATGAKYLVETQSDLQGVPDITGRVAIVTQTTLSKWDTQALIDAMVTRFPQAEVYNEICLATQTRQEAAVNYARQADLVIVVGDSYSNNSNRLVQVVQEIAGKPAYRVDDVDDIDPAWFATAKKVAVTAGASTPSQVTRRVIDYVAAINP